MHRIHQAVYFNLAGFTIINFHVILNIDFWVDAAVGEEPFNELNFY